MTTSSSIPIIHLKKGREHSIKNFHPWIFSGAIEKKEGNPLEGEEVAVLDASKNLLGHGHYYPGSIAVRIFSFTTEPIDETFWRRKITNAFELRKNLGFINNPANTGFRLIHGEADGFPGLIVDIYDKTAVIQPHTSGMLKLADFFAEILKQNTNLKLESIYLKNNKTDEQGTERNQGKYLLGNPSAIIMKEDNLLFEVNIETGQKTGFYLDQRLNRKYFGNYVTGKKVLNLFSYTGAFSMVAGRGGATLVQSVDSSKTSLECMKKNFELNNLTWDDENVFQQDGFEFLKNMEMGIYDIMVLDPPSFAKKLSSIRKALAGYQTINSMALKKIKTGGFLFTFSCSQVIDTVSFKKMLMKSAITSGRDVKFISQFTQSPDHPVSAFHPEGEYLKGFLLWVG